MTETWKPIPGFSRYEASDGGQIRNLDGLILRTRPQNRGYILVTLTDDEGVVRHCTVHTLVLAAHRGERQPGQVARHLNDQPADNRLENLAWGTQGQNERDKYANGRAKPVPPRKLKTCILCQAEFTTPGRRCHDCVVELGKQAEALLRHGMKLDAAAKQLDYPSAEGLHTLAVKYGGYGQPRSRRVFVTLRDRLRRGRGDAT